MKRIILNIGDIAVSREPASLETILGSCVAICLWDDVLKIGGLNHYLLPRAQANAPKSSVYGETSIDMLVEGMLAEGADIRHLQAQIFGGGSVISNLEETFGVGAENVRMAQEKLRGYGIPIVSAHVRARQGIRVTFKTHTGEVMVKPLGTMGERKPPDGCPFTPALRSKLCATCILCGACQEMMERLERKKGSMSK